MITNGGLDAGCTTLPNERDAWERAGGGTVPLHRIAKGGG